MWTRSSVGEARYRRVAVLGRLRYGVVRRSKETTLKRGVERGRLMNERSREGRKEEAKPDRTYQVQTRLILRCARAGTMRRTKLEVMETGEASVRRSGKRVQTYTTESVKRVRRRTTGAWRVSRRTDEEKKIRAYEYPILGRRASIGLMRRVNVNDRIGRYMAVEWLSLALYVMAGFRRGSAYSTEAGLKYYVVGAFGSAWMLLGISMIYGWRGSFNRFDVERRRVGNTERTVDTLLYRVGWQFVRGAILLKLGGVPRHRWLADVYEGAPRASVLYFTVVPKMALFYVRVRRVRIWYTQEGRAGTDAITNRRIGVSVRSMVVGAIGAVTQRRRKRFRAYSAIGHTGYILLGVRVGTREGIQGVRVYTLIYRVMTLVMWQTRSIVKIVKTDEDPTRVQVRDVKYRTDMGTVGKEYPALGLRVMRTCMSMAGVPPMAGFGAKRSVFRGVVGSSYYRLATRAVRTSVVGGYNYLRMVKRRYFEDRSGRGGERVVLTNKPRARRRGREGMRRTRLRVNPSWFFVRTHRMALEMRSR